MIDKVPNVAEVAAIADLLDRVGAYQDADLLDLFVVRASKENNLTKTAGLWSWVWNKLRGNIKKLFFTEYRDLVKEAQRLQELIDEELENRIKLIKEAKTNLKNYQLNDWWNKVENAGMLESEQLEPFRENYGKLMAYVLDLKDKQEKGKALPTDADKSEIGKVPPLSKRDKPGIQENEKELSDEELFDSELDQEWEDLYKKNPNIFQEHPSGMVRIRKNIFNDWLTKKKHLFRVKIGDEYAFKITDRGGQLPKELKDNMKPGSIWKAVPEEDQRFIYLQEYKQPEKKEEVEVLQTPKTPQLPPPLPPDIMEEEVEEAEPEVQPVRKEDIIEERPEEMEGRVAPSKNPVWAKNKQTGNYEIVDENTLNPQTHEKVTDRATIAALNAQLQGPGRRAKRLEKLISRGM